MKLVVDNFMGNEGNGDDIVSTLVQNYCKCKLLVTVALIIILHKDK